MAGAARRTLIELIIRLWENGDIDRMCELIEPSCVEIEGGARDRAWVVVW